MKSGNPQRGRGAIGEGHDTEGSSFLIERIDAGTAERPLNLSIWGGQFQREPDGWWRDLTAQDGLDPRATVSRWRPEFQRDFARRMAWCLPER